MNENVPAPTELSDVVETFTQEALVNLREIYFRQRRLRCVAAIEAELRHRFLQECHTDGLRPLRFA